MSIDIYEVTGQGRLERSYQNFIKVNKMLHFVIIITKRGDPLLHFEKTCTTRLVIKLHFVIIITKRGDVHEKRQPVL